MPKDIFNMPKDEFQKKFTEIYQGVKEENARHGLPTTGYSDKHGCVVDTYPDGRIVKVNVKKTRNNPRKNQYYGY
ncbi:MAG: hypothetical protein ACK4ND_10615 [Cytophagaceae bacterium]